MSLWWRWLAAEGNGEKVPQSWAGEEPEPELGLRLGLELGPGSEQEKWEQQCGLQHCSGLQRHLHWLPEEAAGLTWRDVSGKSHEKKWLAQEENYTTTEGGHADSRAFFCYFIVFMPFT